jgi:hypothetical protein
VVLCFYMFFTWLVWPAFKIVKYLVCSFHQV